MFSFDEFEDMCEKLAEAWQQILMPFEKLSEVLEAIYNDPALWPKRNGVTPKKYGLSLQKIHYGDKNLLLTEPPQRTRNDTCPWKH